jgi:hypothetical protein
MLTELPITLTKNDKPVAIVSAYEETLTKNADRPIEVSPNADTPRVPQTAQEKHEAKMKKLYADHPGVCQHGKTYLTCKVYECDYFDVWCYAAYPSAPFGYDKSKMMTPAPKP